MNDVFARLEDLSAKLNTTSDAITDALKQVEAKLATLRLGVEVWLETPLDTCEYRVKGEVEDIYHTYFGYAKVKGTWHLALRVLSERYGPSSPGALEKDFGLIEELSVAQATREMRIAALKHIPELTKAIEKKAEDELHQIKSALDSVSGTTGSEHDIAEAMAILSRGKDKTKSNKPTIL
jgi:hypothetical protein